MRVLHVINQFCGRAGAEVSLRELVLATEGRGIEHGLVVLKPTSNEFSETDRLGIPKYVPEVQLDRLRGMKHVRVAARTFKPDLLHTSLFEADLAGRVAARYDGIPVLTSLVNTTYATAAQANEPVSTTKRRLAIAVDRLLSRWATTAFHAISEAVADDAAAALKIPREKIYVVARGRSRTSLGTSSPERRALARQALGLGRNQPVILNVARQEPQKAQRYLLRALTVVRRSRPDVVLLMVGRAGRSTMELQQMVQDLDLGERVWWLGVRTDIPDLLCAADVFAFPSLWEGLGGAVLEAMALRLPVVASDIPPLREVLDHGQAGTLVPAGDHDSLAEHLLTVLEGGPAVDARVEVAERRFLEAYELQAVAQQMVELYQQVLAHSAR